MMIYVQSTQTEQRLALHERHPDHPEGEVFIYGDGIFAVARTAAVQRALAQNRLVEVAAPEKPEKPAKPAKED